MSRLKFVSTVREVSNDWVPESLVAKSCKCEHSIKVIVPECAAVVPLAEWVTNQWSKGLVVHFPTSTVHMCKVSLGKKLDPNGAGSSHRIGVGVWVNETLWSRCEALWGPMKVLGSTIEVQPVYHLISLSQNPNTSRSQAWALNLHLHPQACAAKPWNFNHRPHKNTQKAPKSQLL